MNLTKNVTGDWDQAKTLLRADLDKIQRQINAILAQINAPVDALPVPPATISSANTVTTYGGDPLTAVAVKPNGGLAGNGTITNPLYSTGVSVAAAGALTGAGTVASPLSVAVDGVTITIVANQLVAAGTSAITALASTLITVSNAQALAGGDLADVVAAPGPGFYIMPLWVVAHASVATAYAAARDVLVRYSISTGGGGGSAANTLSTLASAIRNATGDYRYAQPATNSYLQTGFNTAANDNVNKSLYLNLGAANANGNAANYLKIKIYYAVVADI